MKQPGNRYINEAPDYHNRLQRRKYLAYRLENESGLVKEESLEVLHEFESLGHEGEII
jgi:hypothetical protein